MTDLEKSYRIDERAEKAIIFHGSVEKAIKFLKQELQEFEEAWSKFSCDSLAHGITCNTLLINWLETLIII